MANYEFPHKIWAHPDYMAKYNEAVARVKGLNPEAVVPSHLDSRGLDHVLGVLKKMEEDHAREDDHA